MQRETGCDISIEEVGEFGIVDIAGNNKESMDKALSRIRALTTVPEVGEVYEGVVKSLQPFGAFVEILPGKDGWLHISEISWNRVDKVEDVLKEGDRLTVKLIEVDARTGKLRLSRRVLEPKPEGYVEPHREPREPRGERRGFEHRDDRRGDRYGDHRGGYDRGGDRYDRGDRMERPYTKLSAPQLRNHGGENTENNNPAPGTVPLDIPDDMM